VSNIKALQVMVSLKPVLEDVHKRDDSLKEAHVDGKSVVDTPVD
jgi:hypothetical protein